MANVTGSESQIPVFALPSEAQAAKRNQLFVTFMDAGK